MKVKFSTNQIEINDNAKLLKNWYMFFIILNLINFTIQVWSRWNEFNSPLLYIFLIFSVLMLLALIFYLFYNSLQDLIKCDEIAYFKVKNILGLKLRYIKLKNNKTRLLYFKGKSKEIKLLKDYLNQNNLPLIC